MIGRFLELGIVSADPGAAWMQLQELGFASANTGDVWNHAYGVAACEGLAIGIHGAGEEALCLYFVRPDVAALHRELTALGVAIEAARLGSDVFNELTLREPGGVAIRVIEARSFSPPVEMPTNTALGIFRAISLPCVDLEAVRSFWERLGVVVHDTEDPWEGVAMPGLLLSYHLRSSFREMALLFTASEHADEKKLHGAGVALGKPVPSLRARQHWPVRGPEGLAMIVLGDEA